MKKLDSAARFKRIREEIEENCRLYCQKNGLPFDDDDDDYDYDSDEDDSSFDSEEEQHDKKYESILDEFVSSHMCSKDDIIWRIGEILDNNRKEMEKIMTANDIVFYKTYNSLLIKFREEVKNLVLMEKLDDFWSYGLDMDNLGIRLQLLAFSYSDRNGNIDFNEKQDFILLETKPQMLTIEEYAERYGVKAVTVRQWIRRGKIRTAQKIGKEWRISEMLEPQGRGYQPGFYKWSVELYGVPQEWSFINDYNSVQIDQLKAGKYLARFYKKNEDLSSPYQEFEIDESERAKLELFLISHPFVKGTDNCSFADGYY